MDSLLEDERQRAPLDVAAAIGAETIFKRFRREGEGEVARKRRDGNKGEVIETSRKVLPPLLLD